MYLKKKKTFCKQFCQTTSNIPRVFNTASANLSLMIILRKQKYVFLSNAFIWNSLACKYSDSLHVWSIQKVTVFGTVGHIHQCSNRYYHQKKQNNQTYFQQFINCRSNEFIFYFTQIYQNLCWTYLRKSFWGDSNKVYVRTWRS